jgi:hypothetical protein
MDPGSALAVASIVLDVTKDLYEYYSLWKSRDEDVAEIRLSLLWLRRLFVALKLSLNDTALAQDKIAMICESIGSCKDIVEKLAKRLSKAKKDGNRTTLLQKMADQGRRTLYPFQKGTIVRLLELIDECKKRLHLAIEFVNL